MRFCALLTVFLTLSTLTLPALAGDLTISSTPYAAGPDPVACAGADLDGDGLVDLGVANRGDDSIHLLLNTGSGFTLPVRYAAGTGPSGIVSGDFDSDGLVDLAVANELSDDIYVFRGDGLGGLLDPVVLSTTERPSSLTPGDFDGDGLTDLAVASRARSSAVVHRNMGALMFSAGTDMPVGLAPSAVHAADITGDGMLDLLVANEESDNFSALLNRGDGTFDPAMSYAAGTDPVAISTGDFDKDGRLDVAVSNRGNDYVSTFLNRGDGTFDPSSDRRIGADDTPQGLSGSDLNGDGYGDLAVADAKDLSVEFFLNDKQGGFVRDDIVYFDSAPLEVATADFDKTGSLDVVSTNPTGDDLYVLSNLTLIVGSAGPADGLVGTTLDVEVNGANFTPASTVEMADLTVNSTTFVDLTKLIANVTIDGLASPGPRDVSVLDPVGGTSVLTDGFLVISDSTPPTVPLNLVATFASQTGITIDWTGSTDPESGVSSYNVYRDGALVSNPTLNSYADSGLAPGSSYRYSVSATNAQGLESDTSEEVCQTTTASFLSPRFPCAGDAVRATERPTFLWNGGPNRKWQVQYSTTSDFSVIQVKSKLKGKSWLKTTHYQPSKKKWNKIVALGAGGKTVFWRVVGKDASKVKTTSHVSRFTIIPASE